MAGTLLELIGNNVYDSRVLNENLLCISSLLSFSLSSCSQFLQFSFLLFLFTFYLLVTFFFLTGTGKDKGVWAVMAFLQGKCEALGKIDLSFLPNIGLI